MHQVEATVQALLHTLDEGTPVKFHLCDFLKEMQYLKLGRAYGLDGIPASSKKTCCVFNTFI
jgi:hypothetical protein